MKWHLVTDAKCPTCHRTDKVRAGFLDDVTLPRSGADYEDWECLDCLACNVTWGRRLKPQPNPIAELERLRVENAALRTALAFYADEETYKRHEHRLAFPIDDDRGDLARAALAVGVPDTPEAKTDD